MLIIQQWRDVKANWIKEHKRVAAAMREAGLRIHAECGQNVVARLTVLEKDQSNRDNTLSFLLEGAKVTRTRGLEVYGVCTPPDPASHWPEPLRRYKEEVEAMEAWTDAMIECHVFDCLARRG